MPELPEVETIARTLKPALVGQTILEADLRWARTLAAVSYTHLDRLNGIQEQQHILPGSRVIRERGAPGKNQFKEGQQVGPQNPHIGREITARTAERHAEHLA